MLDCLLVTKILESWLPQWLVSSHFQHILESWPWIKRHFKSRKQKVKQNWRFYSHMVIKKAQGKTWEIMLNSKCYCNNSYIITSHWVLFSEMHSLLKEQYTVKISFNLGWPLLNDIYHYIVQHLLLSPLYSLCVADVLCLCWDSPYKEQ